MTVVVEAVGASVSLGERTVLRDVSFAIERGEFVGLFGPNGAGKTTLMRAILGLVRPSVGSIRVFGAAAARRGNSGIGYVPQSRRNTGGLRLRGWDFVACAAKGWRWGPPLPGRAGREEVRWALATVGATELAERPLAEMSGGERQRLLLAQALLGRPDLLLLDEPLISLDPRHQDGVVALVKSLQKSLGVTVLFSAHELNPLLGALDRVLYLGRGNAALGRVEEVVTGPVLSKLYESPIEVIRLDGRIFVMSGTHDLEHDEHQHDA